MSKDYNAQGHSLDAQALINNAPFSRYQWLIAIICFSIVFVDGIDTAAMGFIAPALAQDWGIDRSELGPVMSAALGGMIIGALVSGPMADRFGRKIILALSMLMFGGFTLACAYASNLESLVIFRFLTGIGLGAAMPNTTTLFSEYCPTRMRSFLVTCMFCGYNLGMAIGGFLSSWLIPTFGWHSLFLLGGWAPLFLMLLVVFVFPESYRFLIVKNYPVEKIKHILQRIVPDQVRDVRNFHIPQENIELANKHNVFGMLFSSKYIKGTLLLWLTYFMGLVMIYLLTSWLPTLMHETGASLERAAFLGGLFQFGGVISALFIGWAMDRFNKSYYCRLLFSSRSFRNCGWPKLRESHFTGSIYLVRGYCSQWRTIGNACFKCTILSNAMSCDRGGMDVRYRAFWCSLWCLDWCSTFRKPLVIYHDFKHVDYPSIYSSNSNLY